MLNVGIGNGVNLRMFDIEWLNNAVHIRSLIALGFCAPVILVIISFIEKVDKYGFDWPRHKDKKKSTE